MKENIKKIGYILFVICSFCLGYIFSLNYNKPDDNIEIHGCYVVEYFSSISIDTNTNTYYYNNPNATGSYSKIDDETIILNTGDYKDYIIVFYKDSLKLINVEKNSATIFKKDSSSIFVSSN